MGSRPGAARSLFEEFLRVFKVFFLFQRKKTAENVNALQTGLRLLDYDRHVASEQLDKSAGNELLLEDAAKAVVQSSDLLREYEAAERDAKRSFLLDEQRCSALQVEIEEERDQIQKELNHILPDVAKATDALSQINKYHITEMKSFVNPPQLVRLAMQAVCVLLGAPPTWTEALRILADIHFLDRLRNFDKDRVDVSLIERVKLYVNHPDFSMENMKRASIASTTLCKWVLAIVRYFEVMRRVAPTQKKLAETERQFQLIDDMVKAERQKLVDLELKLNELRVEHARNMQRELEWQRNHEGKMRWKAEVEHYAQVVAQWSEVLAHELNIVKTQQFRLVGDCAIFAATLTTRVAPSQRATNKDEQINTEHFRITVKTPQLILIENTADCSEAEFHVLLDLAALAKKKGGHNIVFSTRALGDMPNWKPKVRTLLYHN
ncbi:hypothetical protein P43SY_003858 [Pythium insidiosum]|uniref:Dynein heavy chain coiled coil stalk domain-containing protein n=1 Tax=Pythium insidiosum TaxID=114742 RepID=A0AAD5Q704_PYTIN|nr:hypothetical protein P43SY_003858 [Pythium insidiosum]